MQIHIQQPFSRGNLIARLFSDVLLELRVTTQCCFNYFHCVIVYVYTMPTTRVASVRRETSTHLQTI